MTPIERAERAKQLLGDSVFLSAFEDIRNGLVKRLESSPIGDIDTHHEIALTLQQLKAQLVRYGEEIAVDKQKKRHEEWIEKARQRIRL
jgi:hypothetical protein